MQRQMSANGVACQELVLHKSAPMHKFFSSSGCQRSSDYRDYTFTYKEIFQLGWRAVGNVLVILLIFRAAVYVYETLALVRPV